MQNCILGRYTEKKNQPHCDKTLKKLKKKCLMIYCRNFNRINHSFDIVYNEQLRGCNRQYVPSWTPQSSL